MNYNNDIEDLFTLLKDKNNNINNIKLKLKKYPNRCEILDYYHKNNINDKDILKQIIYKPVRSYSGVIVVTVVLRPDKFSCSKNCFYCPNEPGQPRSYLSNEPAVARANQNDFDAVKQVYSRLSSLKINGHNIDKLELILLGGTFSTYPRDYIYEFIRDLYYAANTYNYDVSTNTVIPNIREKLSLDREQYINETTKYKIIGLSLETRPDFINKSEIIRFRQYGCTRVQLGVQHTDNTILDYINRGHYVEDSIKAIKLLRDNGFKIDLHIMPDLPGSDPEKDKIMIREILTDENFIPDYLKIYPCLDVDFTQIREWKNNGKWKPYAEEDNGEKIIDVLLYAKKLSKRYIRFNRIQRDFCEQNNEKEIIGYVSKNIRTNFRQILERHMKKKGITCNCIRCKEIKGKNVNIKDIFYNLEKYKTNGGKEYFISCNSTIDDLIGFLRLRFNKDNNDIYFNILKDSAIIRELHVYGIVNIVGEDKTSNVQHFGIGKHLLKLAEFYSYLNGYKKICVISGIGVRNYYKKNGYQLSNEYDGNYMYKNISIWRFIYIFFYILFKKIKYIFRKYIINNFL